MKGVKIGAILIVIGIAVAIASMKIEQQQKQEVYFRRMEDFNRKYPPGSYIPYEAHEQITRPIPPQPARAFVILGAITAGIGLLVILIKAIQKTP